MLTVYHTLASRYQTRYTNYIVSFATSLPLQGSGKEVIVLPTLAALQTSPSRRGFVFPKLATK